jgi:hypothetical protein
MAMVDGYLRLLTRDEIPNRRVRMARSQLPSGSGCPEYRLAFFDTLVIVPGRAGACLPGSRQRDGTVNAVGAGGRFMPRQVTCRRQATRRRNRHF